LAFTVRGYRGKQKNPKEEFSLSLSPSAVFLIIACALKPAKTAMVEFNVQNAQALHFRWNI
jgi:hypothetical protein